jgi:uncharacterized protein (DUF1697 family)
MPTHIALLRGINVGGRNRVAMADLRKVVLGLGYTDVATYIQSGNVVFTGEEADTAMIAAALERAIAEHLGVRPKVVVLTRAELARLGAYFTYRQLTNSREQLQISQQGQITERYTRAIDQLGHAQLDVRLGGIYALQRIARDSPVDRAIIGDVLTAFVRSHAPWPPRLPGQYIATASIDQVPELQLRGPDVQASLSVLGEGGYGHSRGRGGRLDLHSVDLRNAELGYAHLEEAYLTDSHLEGATLYRAHLDGAHLEGATLDDVHLERATLDDAHLEGADLGRTHLKGSLANEKTSWPAGFDWRAAGVMMVGKDAAADPPQPA